MQSLNYLDHLKAEIKASSGASKGQRTHALLMYNTAVVLERSGIVPDLVAQVCDLSKVSRGTFYTYFKDALGAAMAVMTDFLRTASGWLAAFERPPGLYDTMVQLLTFDAMLHRENAGLFRCLYVMNPQNATNKRPYRLWQKVRHEWRLVLSDQLAALVRRSRRADADFRKGAALHVTYALAGMADDVLFQMYVADNPFFKRTVPGIDYLVELLAVMWFRSLVGRNPPARKLRTAASEAARLLGQAQGLKT